MTSQIHSPHLVAVIAVATLLAAGGPWTAVGAAEEEADLCAGVPAGSDCTPDRCACDLQRFRLDYREPSYENPYGVFIEEGCFSVQELACPELAETLVIPEPIKCAVRVTSEASVGRFDHNNNNVGYNDDNEHTKILTFPAGLHAGGELALNWTSDKPLVLGIGCDGFLYLNAQGQGKGSSKAMPLRCTDLDERGLCKSSCPTCTLCYSSDWTYRGKTSQRAETMLLTPINWVDSEGFLAGDAILSGTIYGNKESTSHCDSGSDYLLCSGSSSSKFATATCAMESVFDRDLSTAPGGGQDQAQLAAASPASSSSPTAVALVQLAAMTLYLLLPLLQGGVVNQA